MKILLPTMCLAAWTMVMWFWMYAARIPAIRKVRMRLDPNFPRGEQMNSLPPKVRWKADNLNHLMEQPTVFYAVAISLAVMAQDSSINLALAWAYVIIRVIHSIFQSTINIIMVRFFLFVISSLILVALTVNALIAASAVA
jgi:hypothetical protein